MRKRTRTRDTRAVFAFRVAGPDQAAAWLKERHVPFDRVRGDHGESLRVALAPGLEVTFNPGR